LAAVLELTYDVEAGSEVTDFWHLTSDIRPAAAGASLPDPIQKSVVRSQKSEGSDFRRLASDF
jgi:hypothetical protein